jgi:hypothetical protein
MVALASPVPENVGVLLVSVVPQAGPLITGATGGVVSPPLTTGAPTTTGVETVPAGLVWVAEIAVGLVPTGSGVVGVTEKVPLVHVVVSGVPATVTVTVLPVTQVPVIVGVVSVLVVGIGLTVTCGTTELSSTKGTTEVVVLPAGSVTVAVGLEATLVGVVPVQTTVPVEVAGVGTQVVPGMLRVVPGSTPVQVTTTATVPLDGFGTAVHTGASGAVESIVTLATVEGVDVPTVLVAVAVRS